MARPVKVHFFPRSDAPETGWCVPLPKKDHYRLDNILFLHPTPAFGDVIEAREGEDGLTFKRVVKKSGRFTMIFEYPRSKFAALTKYLRALEVETEGMTDGTLYLAVPKRLSAKELFNLASRHFPGLVCIHPRIGPQPKPKPPAPRVPTLFDAADRGDLAAIKRAKPSDLGKLDERGFSLLYIAAREGRTELVKEFLRRGVSPNPRKKGEVAPLIATAMRDRPKEAALLLAAGAKPDLAKDRDGDPLLVLAAFREATKVLPVLLKTGPSVAVLSHALLEAAGVGNVRICKSLLKAGADPDLKTRKGNSARSIAQAKKRREVLALFSAPVRRA
jgi:hypothetical protein